MTAKYPLDSLLRVKQRASKAKELELGECEDAATAARTAAEAATAELAARERGFAREIASEQARTQAGSAKVADLVRAHDYAEHARRTLQAFAAEASDAAGCARQAQRLAGVARDRLKQTMAECKVLDGEQQRWVAEQRRESEMRDEEARDEAWMSTRSIGKGTP